MQAVGARLRTSSDFHVHEEVVRTVCLVGAGHAHALRVLEAGVPFANALALHQKLERSLHPGPPTHRFYPFDAVGFGAYAPVPRSLELNAHQHLVPCLAANETDLVISAFQQLEPGIRVECRVAMALSAEVAVELGIFAIAPVRSLILLEELEAPAQACLLARVDERKAVRKGPAEYAHSLPGLAHSLEFGACPAVFVMIGGEAEPLAALGIHEGLHFFEKFGLALASLGYVVDQMMEAPGVHSIEACPVHPVLLGLCEEEKRLSCLLAQSRDGRGPEVLRYEGGHVAAEAVHSPCHPEAHCLQHSLTHALAAVVELGNVRPVVFDDGVAVLVPVVPLGRLFSNPGVVRGGMVRHPVENHLHSQLVSLGYEGVEVLEGSELRIGGAVIFDCIVRTEGSLASFLANRVERHHPHHIHALLLEPWKLVLSCLEGAFRGELAGVELIDYTIVPSGILRLGAACAGGKQCDGCCE